MEKYELKIFPLFEEDINNTAEYISDILKNPSAAKRLIEETEKAIYKRLDNPLSFPPYKSKKHRSDTYYRIFIGNYTVFYTVIDNVMEIRRFIYSKRDMEEII